MRRRSSFRLCASFATLNTIKIEIKNKYSKYKVAKGLWALCVYFKHVCSAHTSLDEILILKMDVCVLVGGKWLGALRVHVFDEFIVQLV